MNNRTFVICDNDTEYSRKFMQYIGNKKGVFLKTVVFTEKEALQDYVCKQHIDILLISTEMMDGELIEMDVGRIILLSTGMVRQDYAEYPSIYKYQSAENIIREVLNYYAEIKKTEGITAISKGSTELIGVYSPVRRTGQTTFALTLGQILAEKDSVLYINMEEFSAFEKVFHVSYPGDLSDLMYFFRRNQEVLPIKLQAIVNNINGLDYIPPLLYSEDLRNIKTEEWIGLIEKIAEAGSYEKIIIDLSSMVGDVLKLIDICDVSYMPINSDWISLMKVSAYEEYLLKSDREDILNKTVKVKIPEIYSEEQEGNYLEKQLWGKVGDYIRQMLKKTENKM